MSAVDRPRPMRPEEYGQVMAVLERAFGLPEHHWLAQYPGTARDRFVWDDHFVICEEGRVVSHAAIHARTLVADGVAVPVGGLGGVATDPDFQGRGHFRRLMEHLNAVMREREMPLAVLWGLTPRYRHFGYEPAGRRMVFRLAAAPRSPENQPHMVVRGFDPEADLDWVWAAQERELLRVRRTRDEQGQRLTSPTAQTWVGGLGKAEAYVVYSEGRAVECVGDARAALAILSHLRQNYYQAGFDVVSPYRDGPLARGLYGMGAHWRVDTIGLFAVLDLKRALRTLRPLLERKAEAAGLPHSALSLLNRDTGEQATVTWEGGVHVSDGAAGEPIALSAIELTRLLLGPTLERHGRHAAEQRLLDGLFPVDLFIHPLDSV